MIMHNGGIYLQIFAFLAACPLLCKSSLSDEVTLAWNFEGNGAATDLDSIMNPSKEAVVFLLPKFSLASLTRLAGGYSQSDDGGSLKHFKNLVESGGNAILLNEALSSKLLDHPSLKRIPSGEIFDIAKWKGLSRVALKLTSWDDLDALSAELSAGNIMKGRTGLLTAAPTSRKKRDVQPEAENDYTFANISSGECLLYASDVSFVVQQTSEGGIVSTEYPLPPANLRASGNCSNYMGSILLSWSPFTVRDQRMDAFSLGLAFDRASSEWYLANVSLSAAGNMIEEKKLEHFFNGSEVHRLQVHGVPAYSFACGKPKIWMVPATSASAKLRYGVSFRNLQIQPFRTSNGFGFTDHVDDLFCVFLITVFGVAMISSLTTMDRFDDPKGKPLVINAKE
uniref:Uncharacterized protein n=1 Tax=Trichuris muris TaxID=70415 RepID=A0A5S6QXU2_TRIMR